MFLITVVRHATEGVLAVQSQPLIIAALTRALAAPDGLPLVGGKGGMFTASVAGKQAAQECRTHGLVRILRTERKGKTTQDIADISDDGLAFLLREANLQRILERLLQKQPPELDAAILAFVRGWHDRGALEDCPLPEVHRAVTGGSLAPTIGQFHDSLRRLHEKRRIRLHPWTGPLYEIPEPALALLVGHEIAYYASLVS